MGFFDDLVLPEEPAAGRDELIRLGPPGEDDGRYAPPVDRFAPALLPHLAVAGSGPHTRVLSTGWSVWPRTATLHLSVFRTAHRQDAAAGRQSGLRAGLLFSDGRRVTSLDGTVERKVQFTSSSGEVAAGVTEQATGLIPLDPGLHHSRRSLFRTDVDLYLPELPPPGDTFLVVEWPDEDISETRTPIDAAALHAASTRALEVWPGLEPPDPPERPSFFAHLTVGGPPGFLAPPLTRHQRDMLRRQEEERQRHVPRDDWQRIRCGDWGDAALIAARLEGGAPPDARVGWRGAAPLHLAAREGTAEAVAVLLSRRADVDARDDDGHTPLWYAACGVDEGSVGALIDAGADVWTPQAGPWSPGRLLLTTPLAPLVAGLPGAGTLPAEEAAAFAAADELIAAFGARSLWTEGLGIAFVRGLSEDEVIRRLGVDPARCPAAAPERTPFAPEEYDPEEYGDWPEAYEDHEEFLHQVGVTGVPGDPGGCVITQDGYLPNDDAVLRAISAGTTAYGIYFNPKGGTFGTLARDGECVEHEEIGLRPRSQEPAAYWHFRFWQSRHAFPHGANILAYGCEAAGLRIDEGRRVADRGAPRRRVRLPARFRR